MLLRRKWGSKGLWLCLSPECFLSSALQRSFGTDQPRNSEQLQSGKHLTDFPVIEFRRCTIREGVRQHFAQYSRAVLSRSFRAARLPSATSSNARTK
jgi:hypothetical protein